MLEMKYLRLALVEDLFRYKKQGFELDAFPGYTNDQWGIKAHNRPWIEEVGGFSSGQKIIEVGGAYSLFPHYLQSKYSLEAWIADDFGISSGESIWSRWGNPDELPQKYPNINYVFQQFGVFSNSYPDHYFDRVFSVSTLEHIPVKNRLNVIKDMNRCLSKNGLQLHTIDVSIPSIKGCLLYSLTDKISWLEKIVTQLGSDIRRWVNLFKDSGVEVKCSIPSPIQLLDRSILVESSDVVYRFYPPNDKPKRYIPFASLLVVIQKNK